MEKRKPSHCIYYLLGGGMMAICLEFELVEVSGTVARYRYGSCAQEMNGLLEIDLYKLYISREIPEDISIGKIVKLLNNNQSQVKANKVFSKIAKYYQKQKEYPKRGGYFA
jgi:hypothetical protein